MLYCSQLVAHHWGMHSHLPMTILAMEGLAGSAELLMIGQLATQPRRPESVATSDCKHQYSNTHPMSMGIKETAPYNTCEIVKSSDIPKGRTKMISRLPYVRHAQRRIGRVAAVRVPERILYLTAVGTWPSSCVMSAVKIGDRQERVGVTNIQHKQNIGQLLKRRLERSPPRKARGREELLDWRESGSDGDVQRP